MNRRKERKEEHSSDEKKKKVKVVVRLEKRIQHENENAGARVRRVYCMSPSPCGKVFLRSHSWQDDSPRQAT